MFNIWSQLNPNFLSQADELAERQKKRNKNKARLRRLCEMKKNGKCGVPAWVHAMWKSGSHDELAEALESAGFDKDSILQEVL